jgi:hypothetical protein
VFVAQPAVVATTVKSATTASVAKILRLFIISALAYMEIFKEIKVCILTCRSYKPERILVCAYVAPISLYSKSNLTKDERTVGPHSLFGSLIV